MPHPRKFVQNSLAGETEWGAANGRRNIVRNEYSQSKKLWQATIAVASALDLRAIGLTGGMQYAVDPAGVG